MNDDVFDSIDSDDEEIGFDEQEKIQDDLVDDDKDDKSRHYVDNEKLYNDIVTWQDYKASEIAAGRPEPKISDDVAIAIVKIIDKLATRWNYSGYTWRDEMIGDAQIICIKAIHKFNRDDPKKNPFGFLTFITWRAFNKRIKVENKYHEFKMSLMLDETIDGFDSQGGDEFDINRQDMVAAYSLNQ